MTVDAGHNSSANLASSSVDSLSTGLISAGVLKSNAIVRGAVIAAMDGDILSADTLDVIASGDNDAIAAAAAASLAGFDVTVAGAHAEVTSDATTEVRGGSAASIHTTNAINLKATGNNFARAASDAATGALFSLAVDSPEAVVNGATKVVYDGSVTGGTSMTLWADGTNTVESESKVLTGAAIAIQGGTSEATVDDGADTSAILNGNVGTGVLSQKLTVKATSLNRATAVSGGDGGGIATIQVIRPSAVDRADTIAELNGSVGSTHVDPAVGTVGDAGAAEIEVSAHGDDGTLAKVDTFGIGVLAVAASSATSETTTEVRAKLGSGNVTATQNVSVVADSHTDADAFTHVTDAGLIAIEAGLSAEARTSPTVTATVQGGFVQAGQLLTAPHGLTTNDTVVYSAPALAPDDPNKDAVEAGTMENPNSIGGLHDGRTYGVINVDDTTLKLGIEFNAAGVVDTGKAAIHFATEHNLETGDVVIYDCNGGSAIGTNPPGGLVCGGTYNVFKLDERTIRLSNGVPSGFYEFTPSSVAGSVFTVPSTAGLADGQARVYHAPPVLTVLSSMVDITVDGDHIHRNGDQIDHSENNNKIYAPNHDALGFTNGKEVVYTVAVVTTDPTPPGAIPVSPLVPNGHYWVHVDGTDPNRIQLSDSECHAGVGVYDPTPGDPNNGDENTPCSTNIQTISLNPSLTADALKTQHTLRLVGREPILTEGNMYFVDVISPTQFQLLDRFGNPVTPSGTSGGPHRLTNEGIATISNGTGTQRLVIDLASGGFPTGATPHVLVGIGGPSATLGKSDGIVSAVATGVGGGVFRFGDVNSYSSSTPTVSTSINGGTLRADTMSISSFSWSNASTSSVGRGGGFLSFGASDANADVTNTVTTTVAAAATLFATRDIAILAESSENANGESVNKTGGLIGTADTDSTLQIGFQVKSVVAGHVVANRTVLVDAAAALKATVYAGSSSGGLGANSDANDDSDQGIQIGQSFAALAESRIGTGALIRASTVYIAASLGAKHGVDTNGGITSTGLDAQAVARADSHAAALGADSDAAAYVVANDTVRVKLETGSEIDGDSVTLRAAHEHINFQADASSSCSCGGGDTDATAVVNYSRDSRVEADDGSVIRTADLLVETYEFWDRLYAHAHRSGGFLDGGDADASVNNDAKRTITWDADVYLLGEPNPVLIIDSQGTIIAKTYNVTVHAGAGPALQIGDVIPSGQTIVIDAILYDELPSALFVANHVDGVDSNISGSAGVFYMQETWNSVTIKNAADRPILLNGSGSPSVSINTLNASLSTTPAPARRRRPASTSRSTATSATSSGRRRSPTTAAASSRAATAPWRRTTATRRSSTPSLARSAPLRTRSTSSSSRSSTPASTACPRRSSPSCSTPRRAWTCTSTSPSTAAAPCPRPRRHRWRPRSARSRPATTSSSR